MATTIEKGKDWKRKVYHPGKKKGGENQPAPEEPAQTSIPLADWPDVDPEPSEPNEKEEPEKREPFRVSREIRAEIVATTGFDISENDPACALIVLHEIMLREAKKTMVEAIKVANMGAFEKLERMRKVTLERTTLDLALVAAERIAYVKTEVQEADTKAVSMIEDLKLRVKTHRGLCISAGAIGMGLLVLGIMLGSFLHFGH